MMINLTKLHLLGVALHTVYVGIRRTRNLWGRIMEIYIYQVYVNMYVVIVEDDLLLANFAQGCMLVLVA